MNLIKIYMHLNKLKDFNENRPVLVTQMTMSQYDIELLLDLKDISVNVQEKGLLIKKKRFIDKIFR